MQRDHSLFHRNRPSKASLLRQTAFIFESFFHSDYLFYYFKVRSTNLSRLLLLVGLLVGVDDLVELREASAPLEADVGVEKLLVLLDVAVGEDLEAILVEVADHAGVGGALLAGVVEGGAAGAHAPGGARSLLGPGEDVGAGVAVEALGKATHDALLNELAWFWF